MIGVLLAILGRLLPVPAAARGVGEIAVAISSPAGELMAPSNRRMSQTAWYQNRGPATSQIRALTGPKQLFGFLRQRDSGRGDLAFMRFL